MVRESTKPTPLLKGRAGDPDEIGAMFVLLRTNRPHADERITVDFEVMGMLGIMTRRLTGRTDLSQPLNGPTGPDQRPACSNELVPMRPCSEPEADQPRS